MAIIANGVKYRPYRYPSESKFEDDVVDSSAILFGRDTVYVDAKKKIESRSLGGTVPDAFFFDFGDASDPQFYIVEVELSAHSFFNHVFPQITKFFAFFRNTRLQRSLVDKLFSVINTDESIRAQFRRHLGSTEIYKFLSDIIESSPNILLIADGPISELAEVMDTYTDTWGKMVTFVELRKYVSGSDVIYSVTPDFEAIQYAEPEDDGEREPDVELHAYTEELHLQDVSQMVKDIYDRIKEAAKVIRSDLIFNPQKYYISIKAKRNIAFVKIRKKKLRIVAMLPEAEIRSLVTTHSVIALSPGVQQFYNGPCAAVDIESLDNFAEIEALLRELVNRSQLRH
jgi:predicted transport protein